MSFTQPYALLLLLLIPFVVWVGWPRSKRRQRREWLSLILRSLIMLLLTLSLAGAQFVRAADELAVVFLVDASDSISGEQAIEAEAFVREAMGEMTERDKSAVILFGANALVDRPMSGLADLAPITSVPQTLHTDLAEAIRLGLAIFPAGSARRLVILSDGSATIGNTAEAGRLAAASGVQIDYVPLSRDENAGEVWLTAVNAPSRVAQGETVRVDVSVESTVNGDATLRLLANGNIIQEQAVELRRGNNNYVLRVRAAEQAFARYTVQIVPSGGDTYYQNNQLATFTEITGAPRVLLVAPDGSVDDNGRIAPDEAPQLSGALQAAGLVVDRVTPTNLPANLAQLSNYASIVLVNTNAKRLSPRKMETLQTYVRDLGGGLVVVGGPESFGMGGYYKTPLEETLPLDMQIQDQERFPAVSMSIVIDRSGSMGANEGGLTKIQLAAEGAVRVVELLNDFDYISVIPVDTQPSGQIGPEQANDKEGLIAQIRQIGAGGGGIFVRTGLLAAIDALNANPNQVEHVIVLADGGDSEEKNGVEALLDSLTGRGATVSFVAIGNGPDVPWLQNMAEIGNGRFHFTDDAANLPQIFTQETTAVQRNYLVEERFFPTLARRSPILANIDTVPPLYGYVGTSAKPTAQTILESHLGDPVLAQWQYGLGRSVAWTSDATGRWGRDWVTWDGFPTFWAQAVRWTISQGRNSNIETTVNYGTETADLLVDVRDDNGDFLNSLTMQANLVAPDGDVTEITLQQVAPGRYQSSFEPEQEGAYLVRVAGSGDGDVTIGQTSGWVLGYSPEYQQFESNETILASLAEATGGRNVLGDLSAVFDHTLPTDRTTRPIWVWLAVLATLLLPLDIAMRRLVLTRSDYQEAYQYMFGRFLPATSEPTETTEQASRLFEAKKRALDERPVASEPLPIVTSDAVEQPANPAKPKPPAPKAEPIKPATETSDLASKLLKKKRDRNI